MFSVGLNVTTTKKVVNFFWGKKECTARENPGYQYEKRAPPDVGMGSPRMVNPVLAKCLLQIIDMLVSKCNLVHVHTLMFVYSIAEFCS